MSASLPDIRDLAQRCWGAPNAAMSSRTELRFGTNGSKSLKLADRTWFDHEADKGGGYADLHEAVLGVRPADVSIACTYDYTDEHGALVYQVVRKVPKKFVQRRPDGNGGWEWNLHGIRRVPYRLPDLLRAAPDATAFIVEGEKDADALRERMLIATTNAGGAGKWEASFATHFRNRRVIILPDNDEAGESHARDVQAKLSGICASVVILRLPDLPPKGDVSDWLAAGGTAELLEEIAAANFPPAGSLEAGGEKQPTHATPQHQADSASVHPHRDPLREALSIEAWATKDIDAPERILGDLVSRTSRTFLVGSTGLGKTMFGLALACGMASGEGFLHWRSERPVRVLYVDGEMPAELIKARSIDALRRVGRPMPAGNLCIFARDMEDEVARQFADLGKPAPLNTPEGQDFILRLVETIGDVQVIIFDNVMSLLAGDQREEIPWSETIPLIEKLTKNRIGQIWLDHTGHDTKRQYGSSTKAWRFDSVAIMAPLAEDQRTRNELGFTLSFDSPGKARRRTPDNWRDFETCTMHLVEDAWSVEFADGRAQSSERKKGKVPPEAVLFHSALLDALARTSTPGVTTKAAWAAEAERRGLLDRFEEGDDHKARSAKRSKLRKYQSELLAASWIGIEDDAVRSLTGGSAG